VVPDSDNPWSGPVVDRRRCLPDKPGQTVRRIEAAGPPRLSCLSSGTDGHNRGPALLFIAVLR
jgi:hypothetical protein